MRKPQYWFILYLNIPNKHATAYITYVTKCKIHASHCIICSFLFAMNLLHSQAEALQSSRALWKARFLVRITKSITFTHDFVAALLSFWDFFSSVALSCFAWTETYFLSFTPPPLFIANSNGANVVCHSMERLWAVRTTGTFLLVSSTPRR